MSSEQRPPNVILSTALLAVVAAVWGGLRLALFGDSLLPLTFVLPLLLCVWSRRRWQLWGMAGVFAVMAAVKTARLVAEDVEGVHGGWFLATTLFNIGVGALAVHLILSYRDRIESARARIAAQNAELELQAERLQQQNTELESQAEELSQQNEEIKAQTEELAQQYEEIEAQSEELAQQNEELADANQRLRRREDLLHTMLEASRSPATGTPGFADTCERMLAIMGSPAAVIALLEVEGGELVATAMAGPEGLTPERWPIEGSLGRVVLEEAQTAYVSDLAGEPGLSAPFGTSGPVQSILATPLRVGGRVEGMVAACSLGPAHWSAEHFRLLEWFAAQCGLILESHRWQTALRKHAGDAEAANEAKDRFLAMLSHELRTPLTPVLAAAGGLANDETLPEHVREELRMIRRNVSIQNRLIDDLLDLTRIGSGKLVLERERLNLGVLMRSALDITAPDLAAQGQRFVLDVAVLDDCRLDGDGARLQQVFWNLLKNAVKFSPAGGDIVVKAERSGDRATLRVRDHGVGLEDGDLERIFEPFEQVRPNGTANGTRGLGLGLAIARSIVGLHGGVLRAESAGPGQGATFVIELPVLAPGEESASPVAPAAPTGPARSLRILLAEDHADTGRVIARLLRAAGHAVEFAATGLGALDLAGRGRFDLVLSDLGLPDIDGCELMRRVRALDPTVLGVCMSGYGAEKDVQRARQAGFTEHLTKPVDVHVLYGVVARIGRELETRRSAS